MGQKLIISGTDTDIGKTVFAASLTLALDGVYWKPVQSGTDGGTDTQRIREMTGLSEPQILPERYILSNPLSPHRAAENDEIEIDVKTLTPPDTDRPLIIEGAGGLLVPVTRQTLYIDLFKLWNIPLILCARTGLGTINHTLLSIEALKKRNIPVHGIAFIGDQNDDNMRTITDFSGAHVLGRLPILNDLNPKTLLKAFNDNFDREDFKTA